jgi:CRP-like cAMP-binding protein
MGKNVLLTLLSREPQDQILDTSEVVQLHLSEIVCVAGKPREHIYFPMDGFISITQTTAALPPLEIGMVGREGGLGIDAVLGASDNAFSAIVQGAGSAHRISAADFLRLANDHLELRQLAGLYLAVRTRQLGQSVACEHFHKIESRLAKWLLMSQDRAQSSTFFMTHEFISLMLGVRRVGVTSTAATFKRNGLIDYHRGNMKILSRSGLKAMACSCYLRDKRIYSSLIC